MNSSNSVASFARDLPEENPEPVNIQKPVSEIHSVIHPKKIIQQVKVKKASAWLSRKKRTIWKVSSGRGLSTSGGSLDPVTAQHTFCPY